MLSDTNSSPAWEYTIVHTDRLTTPAGPQLAPMWRRKYADGTTDWDQINKLGADGWEMVSAFPIEAAGTLQYVAFVFKRHKRAAQPPAPSSSPLSESAGAGEDSEPSEPEAPAG